MPDAAAPPSLSVSSQAGRRALGRVGEESARTARVGGVGTSLTLGGALP